MNNWKRIGLESKDQAIKYLLASLHRKRLEILDAGLGGEYKGKDHSHGIIPELYEAVFILGNRTFTLTKRGFQEEK